MLFLFLKKEKVWQSVFRIYIKKEKGSYFLLFQTMIAPAATIMAITPATMM